MDIGSEITCISESFFINDKNTFKNCEILSIVGTSVVGTTRYDWGVSCEIEASTVRRIFNKWKIILLCILIIPKLNKNYSLGVDLLKRLKEKTDLEENVIELRDFTE